MGNITLEKGNKILLLIKENKKSSNLQKKERKRERGKERKGFGYGEGSPEPEVGVLSPLLLLQITLPLLGDAVMLLAIGGVRRWCGDRADGQQKKLGKRPKPVARGGEGAVMSL